MCQYAEHLSRDGVFNFGPQNVEKFREKMAYEIVTNQVLTPDEIDFIANM